MINKWFKLGEKLRYLLIGGFNTATSTLLYIICYSLLQGYLHYLVLAVIVHLVSVFQSFILLKYLVFQTLGSFWREYLKTNITYLLTLCISLVLLYTQVDVLQFDPRIAAIINAVLMAIISYFLHKFFSFRVIN